MVNADEYHKSNMEKLHKGCPTLLCWEHARTELGQLEQFFRRVKLRKFVPPWAAPAELWRMVLCWNDGEIKSRWGVGFRVEVQRLAILELLTGVLAMVRSVAKAPSLWNQFLAIPIPKRGSTDPRLINTLDPMGKQ